MGLKKLLLLPNEIPFPLSYNKTLVIILNNIEEGLGRELNLFCLEEVAIWKKYIYFLE